MSDARWRIRYESRARRDLKRLDPQVSARVIRAIERVALDPETSSGLRKLAGRPESRLRVGDWRVLLECDHAARELTVVRVLPRGRAYDR